MPDKKTADKKRYLAAAILLFIVEVLIALFVNDDIVRPHVGDLLVVILIYCFTRALLNWNVMKAAVVTLLFSYIVETLQYFRIVEVLGLQGSTLARVVIGTHFSWIDILAYTAGIVLVLIVEKMRKAI